ncbi:hypothetical protein A3C91_01675 [Candidatus Azambacteria bacterium RIFCSPHIGHO2_02_FULL_52_12]|uniref:Type II secretion system protein GspG C-terminal domain-containing protein n=1 Tax=Candidatus Azambacteria bacterium RIFCSPLOWO2_01_FULL_46_25 TaxID=1797298 RepID=A0A1F5BVA7_9BACT|nr:MAG: hypothetical protein A3C91_01675 [Candidatus Azambacteria bacterium RIFCSPHIGHO2_02_FULL_52_12]OGD34555.1 MAG: hypothetical protein A2988_03535 [Candidatus Azambacteria bacterium RIFCSPLOWO2_01_FULL_46_25]OGD36429.1 MAG: hypothetical protein A2850_02035 [Candidatus Azambacteria bacterium RIFCSPHIGHO2_01_FULL_51_74]
MNTQLKKGFTLIELLVVIAIIGILSSVVIVSLNNARSKARDSSRKSNAQAMATGIALYASEQIGEIAANEVAAAGPSGWSQDATGGTAVLNNGLGAPDITYGTPALSTFLRALPVDSANTYNYGNAGLNATYCLGAALENADAVTTGTSFLCKSGGCGPNVPATDSNKATQATAWAVADCTEA